MISAFISFLLLFRPAPFFYLLLRKLNLHYAIKHDFIVAFEHLTDHVVDWGSTFKLEITAMGSNQLIYQVFFDCIYFLLYHFFFVKPVFIRLLHLLLLFFLFALLMKISFKVVPYDVHGENLADLPLTWVWSQSWWSQVIRNQGGLRFFGILQISVYVFKSWWVFIYSHE